MSTKTFVSGKVYVRKTRCSTCIFGKKSPVDQDRTDEMIAGADAAESCIPCHSHLYEGADIEPVCKGYFDRKSSATLRLAEAMGMIVEVGES